MRSLAAVVAAVLLSNCSEGTGPGSALAIKFRVDASPAASASLSPGPRFSVAGSSQGGLEIVGTNGTLTITAITLIVEAVELDPVESGDCNVDPSGCQEIEAGPFVVDVPLTGDPVTVASQDLEPGAYEELEFEVEDFTVEEDEDGAAFEELLATIRERFPDWPLTASMIVEGSFTPTGGSPTEFRAYFEAELEVELAFDPPLEIAEADQSVVVDLRPATWFTRPDGSVVDLSQFDFPTTGQLIEFQLELEDGLEIELD